MYVDKNNSLVKENDLFLFDYGSIYRLVRVEKAYCLKSITASLPMIRVDMIAFGNYLSSATLIKNNFKEEKKNG